MKKLETRGVLLSQLRWEGTLNIIGENVNLCKAMREKVLAEFSECGIINYNEELIPRTYLADA